MQSQLLNLSMREEASSRSGRNHGPGYSKTAAAPIPVPIHMDTTP